MSIVYLLLGGNQGNRVGYLADARHEIDQQIGAIISKSSLYESEAWGFVSDNFINQVICVETPFSPSEVLLRIQTIETAAGRIRHSDDVGYSARNLDIDILFYDHLIIDNLTLIIPHPRLHQRRFTLLPLCELAPQLEHPVLKCTMQELLLQCDDSTGVWLYRE